MRALRRILGSEIPAELQAFRRKDKIAAKSRGVQINRQALPGV